MSNRQKAIYILIALGSILVLLAGWKPLEPGREGQ